MIQREFRLVCQGIQLISVFEVEEFSKSPKDSAAGFNWNEESKKPSSAGLKDETNRFPDLNRNEGFTF